MEQKDVSQEPSRLHLELKYIRRPSAKFESSSLLKLDSRFCHRKVWEQILSLQELCHFARVNLWGLFKGMRLTWQGRHSLGSFSLGRRQPSPTKPIHPHTDRLHQHPRLPQHRYGRTPKRYIYVLYRLHALRCWVMMVVLLEQFHPKPLGWKDRFSTAYESRNLNRHTLTLLLSCLPRT